MDSSEVFLLHRRGEMESKPTAGGVLRRIRPLGGTFRYYPYASGTVSGKEGVKEEVVRLAVELSLAVAESMFLLCDDSRTMLWFCFKLWKYTLPPSDPVSERLLLVINYVYSNHIKPHNRVYHRDGGNSVQWELIRTTWKDFTDGIIVLHRLVLLLRRKDCSFDDRLLSSAITKYKQQVLKKLEHKLRSAKDVSEANGFARETMESNVSDLWKSLFDEEAGEATRVLSDLFQPILSGSWRSEIPTLPVYSPYILGDYFAQQQLREEVVLLGVELSLYVAESMFLLCDDIRSMLRFCFKLWRGLNRDLTSSSPVVERLLRVIHLVYSRNIKPKNGVNQIGGKSAQYGLMRETWEKSDAGIRDLHNVVLILQGQGNWADGRELTSSIEETLKKVEEKLRCAKDVSDANGFARDAMESEIVGLWKTLFDKETEETWTLKVTRGEILMDLFQPILSESEIPTLGKDFTKQELREEAVRLGVEVSLCVAESMFLVCDDIYSMLRFCWNIWRRYVNRDLKPGSPVGDRLLRVIHLVYSRTIKPENGVYQIGCKSAQYDMIREIWEKSDAGIRDLHDLVSVLGLQGNCRHGPVFMSRIEKALKKVEGKLRCAKDVSEANGFVRDAMESEIVGLWKTMFDKETELKKVTREEILSDLFQPLVRREAAPKH